MKPEREHLWNKHHPLLLKDIEYLSQNLTNPKTAKPAGPDRRVFALDFPKSMSILHFRNSAMHSSARHFADIYKMHVNSALWKVCHVNRHSICRQAVCEPDPLTEKHMSMTGKPSPDM